MQCLAEGMEGAHWGLDFKVRGCITNWSLNTSCVLRGSNLQAWESPQGLLIDEKRKAALDNLYQLISTRVSRGLMHLRSKGWKQKDQREFRHRACHPFYYVNAVHFTCFTSCSLSCSKYWSESVCVCAHVIGRVTHQYRLPTWLSAALLLLGTTFNMKFFLKYWTDRVLGP